MTHPVVVPGTFADNAARTWGEEGREWSARLPELVEELCAEWAMRVEQADYQLSYNFVVPVALKDGASGVLKLGIPWEVRREIEALRIFDGRGVCRVLASDMDRGAALLERIRPGVPLLALGESPEAVLAAVDVIGRMRTTPPQGHGLPRLVDWWRAATGGLEEKRKSPSPLPTDLVEEADAIYEELRARPDEVVLHGDLHHWNILSSERERWLAIDPHGVTGPPECEIGAFMMNPNDGPLVRPDVRAVLGRRLDQFAEELGFERESLRRASFAYAVLSSTWSAEDGSDAWQPGIEIAGALRDA